MASDWVETTLGDISTDVSYGYTESANTEKVGPKFLRITDIQNGVVDWKSVPYCPIDNSKLDKYLLERGDIVVARTGNSTGENYIFTGSEETVYASYLIRFRIDESIANPFYVWYSMRSPNWWAFVNSSKTGSAQAGANAKILGLYPLGLPSLDTQKAIAHILGSLDDKTELNRKMNVTLETMAQVLFKSWFVDFDPVIDNALAAGNAIPDEMLERAELRKGIEKKDNSDIQNLFPDEFEFTEGMGWIPKGWEINTLEDLAVISSSKRIFAKEYKTEGIPFFRGKEISLLSKGDNFTSDIFISKERFFELKDKFGAPSAGDLLLTSVGTIGNVYLVQEGDEFYFKDGNLTWFSQYKTEIKGGYLSTWFKTRQAYLAIENIKIGSTQQAITISSLNGIKIIKPENNIISLFNDFSENAVKKIALLNKERQTLSSLRDTLLPKLMSGELRIADAAALVDEAL